MANAGRGFEQAPRGTLIHQLIDLRSAMGIAYERSLEFYKRPHVHDRAILVFPRGGSAMDVTITGESRAHRLTSADGMVVAAEVEHDDRAASFVYDTFALLPSRELLERTLGTSVLPTAAFRRSPWLDALLEEYFAERVLGRGRSSRRAAHLEALVLFEVADAVSARDRRRVRPRSGDLATASGPMTVAARALRYVEANLFAPLDLGRLARAAGASRSSLLRHFRAETGLTPLQYVRARRLEDASVLLARGEHNVSEVARLVGYSSLAAFSEAYRARFGEAPSSARPP